jgi:hypothetical protein
MSHFTVAVITDGSKELDEIMAPYEEKSVPRYVKFTKEQAIANQRKKIEDYKNGDYYQEYIKDPEKYLDECKNNGHAKYISEIFPAMLNWTDEQCYDEAKKYYEENEIGENGELYSTYNPKSKWDYYSIGGRWDGYLPLKIDNPTIKEAEGVKYIKEEYEWVNSADLKDIAFDRLPSQKELDDYYRNWIHIMENESDYKRRIIEEYKDFADYIKGMTKFSTYAVVTPDGEWHEPGSMGWWGISSASVKEEKEFKDTFFEKYIKPYENCAMTMVDCHI